MDVIYREEDHEFWQKYLDDFVPAEIYDMHTHLWTEKGQEDFPPDGNPLRLEIDLDAMKKFSENYYPNRKCHFQLLGTPARGMNVRNHNRFLAEEGAKDPESITAMIVTPETDPAEVDEGFTSGKFQSVKPYRVFAPDPAYARITEYLPEKLLEVIDHHKKAVVLHLSIPQGADSELNQKDLQDLTKRYPNVKFVLAHCARAFNANFLVNSIHVLKYIPNLYYDTSAVNDLYTHYLLLKHEDRTRIMFGSDIVAAGGDHGKYITYADAWQFYPGAPKLEHCPSYVVPVIYEQLLQQKRAADMLDFSADDIDRLFRKSAQEFIRSLRKNL